MSGRAEELESLIGRLRAGVREAVLGGDRRRAAQLRRDLRQAESDWEDALADAETVADTQAAAGDGAEAAGEGSDETAERGGGPAAGSLLPLRDQVHEALVLLSVPSAPKMIVTVREAFFASTFPSGKLTSLKRDEERSFRSAPHARPYYICAALSADFLSPSRGLLAISTWPMERRVIGSLSPRVDFLTAAIQVANAIERIPATVPAARRLLWRFAASIPGAAGSANSMEPRKIIEAAETELKVHADADASVREEAAERARSQLDDAQRLFGIRVQAAGRNAAVGNGAARNGEGGGAG
jgi:hypothetical protein